MGGSSQKLEIEKKTKNAESINDKYEYAKNAKNLNDTLDKLNKQNRRNK